MNGDFSRLTFDPKKHYNRVNMQQGRVQADADWNEQQEIYQHLVETETVDIIGRSGGPMHGAGFLIIPRASTTDVSVLEQELQQADSALRSQIVATGLPNELFISKGGYYVDGILCTNEAVVAYTNQPDFPRAPAITQPGFYLAYLDVWPQHITALEDPHIREVALGGPDTATRLKTVWQVKLLPLLGIAASVNCQSSTPAWSDLIAPTSARLSARAKPSLLSSDPCVIASGAGYRRLENQLYRVEIHKPGGVGSATFKWSRDNGSVVTGWLDNPGGPLDKVKVGSIGPDQVLGFAGGQWVELTDSEHELRGERGTLVRLVNAEADLLTINPATAAGLPVDRPSFPLNPQVRRWDSEGEIAVSIPTANEGYIALEDGVEVRFDSGPYKTGDYWLIPARTDTADVEWPRDTTTGPLSLPPHGIQHHYCRLAMLSFNNGAWTVLSDCRDIFPPLTELTSFFYVGGDGQEAMPDSAHPSLPTPLARPLEVGVANGEWPVEGARVRFTVKVGNGTLVPANGLVTTGPKGIASCGWILGRGQTNPPNSQQVEAVLLDDSNNPINTPIHFNANLSVADQVAYDPKGCGSLANETTVQDAIDRLSSLASLFSVSGDNQSGEAEKALALPLVVVAASKCGPVAGMKVAFTVISGGGSVSPSLPVMTGANGQAACVWTLGRRLQGPQVVEAVLTSTDPALIVPPAKVWFTAQHLQRAICVTSVQVFSPISVLGTGTGGGMVSGQLSGQVARDSARAVDVQAIGPLPPWAPLANDSQITLEQLIGGLRVVCSESIDDAAIIGRNDLNRRPEPTCFVTLEAPVTSFSFPYTPAPLGGFGFGSSPAGGSQTAVTLQDSSNVNDARLAGSPFIVGYTPLTVAGAVQIFDRTISWRPSPGVEAALNALFALFGRLGNAGPLLARLRLKGRFVSSTETDSQGRPALYLDGAAFGLPSGDPTRTDIILPSGDHTPGRDFEMWFWVKPTTIVRGPVFWINTRRLDFGNLTLGAFAEQVLTIRNTGDAPFQLVGIDSNSSVFTARVDPLQSFAPDTLGVQARAAAPSAGPADPPPPVQSRPVAIGPNEGVTVMVRFSCAGSPASYDASLTIRTDASVWGGEVELLGTCLDVVQPPRGSCKTNKTDIILTALPGGSANDSASITNDGFVPAPGEDPFTLSNVSIVLFDATATQPTLSATPAAVSARDIIVTPPFSIVGPPSLPVVLANGKSQVVTVKYDRRANILGEERGQLIFTINKNFGCPAINIIGRGIAVNPILDVSGSEVDFGAQNRAGVAGRDIVVRNPGTAKLEVKASAGQPHLKVSPEQATIEPGGAQTLKVSFAGTAIPATEKDGPKTAAVTITSNDPINPSVSVPVKWNLTSEPVKNPILDVSVKEIDLGNVTRATAADKTIVLILNKGDALLEVKPSSDQPVLTVSPEQMSIDPGGSQKLVVRFVGTAIPATEKDGAKTAAITITSNDPIKPTVSVPVTWNLTSETVKTPALTLSATEIDLGNVTRATTLDKTIIKIGNTGNAPLDVKVSTDRPQLTLSLEQVTIDVGGSEKLVVRFVGTAIPANEKAGAKTAAINIASNDPSHPTVLVPVRWNLTNEPVMDPVKVGVGTLVEKPVKGSTRKQRLSAKEKPGPKQKRRKPKQ